MRDRHPNPGQTHAGDGGRAAAGTFALPRVGV